MWVLNSLAHSTVSPLMVTWFCPYYKMTDNFRKFNLFSIKCKCVRNCYEEQCVTYNTHLLHWFGNSPWFFWYKLIRFDAENKSVILTCSLIYSTSNDNFYRPDTFPGDAEVEKTKPFCSLRSNGQKEKQTVDNEKKMTGISLIISMSARTWRRPSKPHNCLPQLWA